MLRKIDAFFMGDRRAVRVLVLIGLVNMLIFGALFASMVFFPESSDCDAACKEEIRRTIEDIVGKDGNQFDPKEGLDETLGNG
jgi:hypothetical protein